MAVGVLGAQEVEIAVPVATADSILSLRNTLRPYQYRHQSTAVIDQSGVDHNSPCHRRHPHSPIRGHEPGMGSRIGDTMPRGMTGLEIRCAIRTVGVRSDIDRTS